MARFHAPPIPHDVGDEMVRHGFLLSEPDAARADVILVGGSYRYTLDFWRHVGAVVEGAGALRIAGATEAALDGPRARIAEEWVAAGASPWWASLESQAAVTWLRAHGTGAIAA